MKEWQRAEVVELDIAETAHDWFGIYRDGGYIGDGVISGHGSFTKPQQPEQPQPTTPSQDDHS